MRFLFFYFGKHLIRMKINYNKNDYIPFLDIFNNEKEKKKKLFILNLLL